MSTSEITMKSSISPRFLSSLFASLSSSPSAPLSIASNNLQTQQWHLHRILRSDNPADINGELNGIATFHPLQHTSSEDATAYTQMVYKEEGEMPSSVMGMAGLRWTKKYIWRLNGANAAAPTEQEESPEMGGISVWFVKIKSSKEKAERGDQDEPDYLFHEFDFNYQQKQQQEPENTEATEKPKFEPPTPPPLILPHLRDKYPETVVIQATGDHLCIKDMYYTAYSFRVVPETGDVLSWASRHVVKGPKKNQDILNLYSIQ
ncbi:hypothetical protein TMatcc_008008 [Talaromyces marneffei ATCC 18224]|uniref:DUF6314 domain-containing protein n=2 Tax=Talaromyces marneffei TaxID=37727 RepID=B6QE62_TALMQ|nr:uncharacterized protein EYB26_004913 [Talaromyces marneffei]EEA24907.1 conserved hypothetical protein [Talaromyces marneffei ATCC 18224]QGA17243.1 hypothetical protein EYB26_004913 [Talaromyces marneffei]